MRRRGWLLAWIPLAASAAWAASDTSPPPDYRPPATQEICPALAEDFELCSEDAMSGNCADYVTAAGRLGEIYRSELRAHPGWIRGLQTTVWWGCGTARFEELTALLERIDTPAARAVLAQEPYRSLREPLPTAPEPPPAEEPDCTAPASAAERDQCAARELTRAQAIHAQVLDACRQRIAPGLRQELVGAEAGWERTLPLECEGTGAERDDCLAQAYRERARSIAAMHPECAASGR